MAEVEETALSEKLSIDEQAMLGLLVEANAIERGLKIRYLEVDGKRWRVRDTSKWQNKAMLNHDFDIRYWQQELNSEGVTRKRAKKLNGKIRKAFAKKAAHRVLGRKLWLLPFAFLLTWLRIYNASEKVSATINSEGAINEARNFYLANLGSSKRALALSTMQVGEVVKQRQEREASVANMLEEDALPKKEEDSKSGRPLSAARTTRR